MSVSVESVTAGLPGIALPGYPAAPRPDRLLRPGTLLLAGALPDRPIDRSSHLMAWGPNPSLDLAALVDAADAVNLVGAGGAGFPTARKLSSMRDNRVARVVVNAAEGEQTSAKDGVLVAHAPHLVLDGAELVARALGCSRVIVRVAEDRPGILEPLETAIAQRSGGLRFEISAGPARFVAGEASAVVSALSGRDPAPADLGKPPRMRRPLIRGSHVFLSNVETFARLALAARGDTRTSALVTVSGAVRHAGVLELDEHATLGDLGRITGVDDTSQVLITGGWHGAWVPWPARAELTRDGIARIGGRWGAGAFVWLPGDLPPQTALAAVVAELAGESAGQCGPCVFGLPELAAALARGPSGATREELAGLLGAVDGRGLCAHPTATAAAVRSALVCIDATKAPTEGVRR